MCVCVYIYKYALDNQYISNLIEDTFCQSLLLILVLCVCVCVCVCVLYIDTCILCVCVYTNVIDNQYIYFDSGHILRVLLY